MHDEAKPRRREDSGRMMDVTMLVSGIAAAYATTPSYQDSGTVVVEREGRRVTAAFETAFERRHRFFFAVEVRASDAYTHAHRMLAEGDQLRVGDPAWRAERPESIGAAVADLAGVSLGSAHTIPRLLMPEEVGGTSLFDGHEPMVIEDVVLDGVPHLQIETRDGERRQRVCVARDTFFIRRVLLEAPSLSTLVDYVIVLPHAAEPPRGGEPVGVTQ